MKKHLVGRSISLARKLFLKRVPLLPKLLWTFNRIVFACDVSLMADIDRSVDFYHNALGVVVSRGTVIGANCSVYQNVTFGGRKHRTRGNGHPIVGKNVVIYPGAVVLGPISIGDNSTIGANAVVIDDVPEGMTVAGIPARVLAPKSPEGDGR